MRAITSWMPRQKTGDPWVRDKGPYCWQHRSSMSFRSVTGPLGFKSHGATNGGPGGCCAFSGCASELRNVRLRKPKSFITDCSQTCPLPKRKSHLYLPRLLAVQTSLKRQSGAKGQLVPLFIKWAQMPQTMKDCLPTKSSLATWYGSCTVLPPTIPCTTSALGRNMNSCYDLCIFFLVYYQPGCSLKSGTVFSVYLSDTKKCSINVQINE